MESKTYLSCAETAKLLRQALKESFPGQKFSVRSSVYSGGASIDVSWLDGPTSSMVKSICSAFEGSYFDGMIDYKGSNYHKLDGKPVDLGADFIFEHQKLSKARAEQLVNHFAEKFGRSDWIKLEGCDYFGYRAQIQLDAPYIKPELDAYDAATCGFSPQPSATLARLLFTGDDGYGGNTVGNAENGYQTHGGYPRQGAM